MHEKMTDEQLDEVLERIRFHVSSFDADVLEAQIAVLTAEVEAERAKGPMAESAGWLDPKAAAVLTAERDQARFTAKERANDLQQMTERCQTAEDTLAAIRQRAGDGEPAMLERAHTRFQQARNEGLGVAAALEATVIESIRYVVGEDGTGALPPERICEHVGEGEVCATCHPPASPERTPEPDTLCSRCGGGGVDPGNPEPTAAEAFAAMRRELEFNAQDAADNGSPGAIKRATEALSGLFWVERRMGAQETVIRAALTFNTRRPAEHQWGNELHGLARAALTDAPPVFTLEEVETLERVACECPWRVEATRDDKHAPGCAGGRVREALAALRKVKP